jgi:hypothetical protein
MLSSVTLNHQGPLLLPLLSIDLNQEDRLDNRWGSKSYSESNRSPYALQRYLHMTPKATLKSVLF